MKRRLAILGNSTLFIAISSFISQLLGFLRDKILSHIYGAGFVLDSYYAAFRVPEFIYLSVGSFVSSAILVPYFSKKLYEDDIRIWFQKLFTTFLLFFIFIYGIIIFFLPKIISNLYKHSSIDFQRDIILYGSILLISTLFLSMSSIISSVAQVKRDFIHVGLAPVLYNLGTILGIVMLRPFLGITGVCIGVVLGSIMHLCIQLPEIRRSNLFLGYGKFLLKSFSFSILREMLSKSIMRTISLSLSAVTFFLITYFASLYPAGSITIIAIAFSIQTVFHTLTGVSYATTILPLLAKEYTEGNIENFTGILNYNFRNIYIISLLLTGFLYLFHYEIIYFLFGSGNFNIYDVVYTGLALFIFSISLIAQNTILLMSRAAYAMGDYFLPLFTNFISALATYVFSFFLYKYTNTKEWAILAIPIAYSAAQFLSMFLGLLIYNIKYKKTIKTEWLFMVYGLFTIIVSVKLSKILMNFIYNNFNNVYLMYGLYFVVFWIYILFIYYIYLKSSNSKLNNSAIYFKNVFWRIVLALLPKRS